VFREEYGAKYPKALAKLDRDWMALTAFYDYPAEHWRHLRTTNPNESSSPRSACARGVGVGTHTDRSVGQAGGAAQLGGHVRQHLGVGSGRHTAVWNGRSNDGTHGTILLGDHRLLAGLGVADR
jgi:hypothetical protein